MQATVLDVFGDLYVRLSVCAMVHALASLWVNYAYENGKTNKFNKYV